MAEPQCHQAYLDALPDGVVATDGEGVIRYANATTEQLTGIPREELLGRPLDEALPLRDEAGNTWWQCSAKLRRLRGVRRTPVRELTLSAPVGELRVDLTASFVRDQDGQVEQVVCELRDAMARRRADAKRGELITNLAHELRAPLASVKGFTLTMLHRWDRFTDEQKRTMLETINMDADRVVRLMQELLDISRIEAGRLELRRRSFNLPAMAKGIVARFEVRTDRHAFVTEFPDDFPEVYADPDKIEQVLLNLVENAVKYSDGGKVTIAGEATEDDVEVAVRDEGAGIPPDQLLLIFTKYYRRAGQSAPTGTGLGLYITRGLVEAHGGKIWATSELGRGTEVRFRLPRVGLEP